MSSASGSASSSIKTKSASYELVKKLSAGAFSEVWLGRNSETQEPYAIKIINGQKNRGFTTNEIAAYRELSHPNLIKVADLHATAGEETVYVVMQWAPDGDLRSKITEHGLPEEEAREIFKQVLAAVKYMHSKGWIHRDIKPDNVLIHGKQYILTDLGFASRYEDSRKGLRTSVGTPGYCAPEILDQRSYCGPEVDVWGLGILLYSMLVGKSPHRQPPNGDPDQLVTNIRSSMEKPLDFPSHISAPAQTLIGQMLTVNVDDRIDIDEIAKSTWLCPPTLVASPGGAALKKKPSLIGKLFGAK